MLFLGLLISLIALAEASSNTIWTSACNPLQRTCPADAALGTSLKLDFSKTTSLFSSLSTYQDSYTKYTDSGLQQVFSNHGQYPAIISSFYLMYGKVEISSKIAPGVGMVSNLILQSDTGDEIDFQWFGASTKEVQSNYYGKGVTGTNDRGETYTASSDLSSDYHNYTIDWSDSQITWAVDGKVIRTFKKSDADTSSHQFPDSPMKIILGLWAGGDSNDNTIVQWAGGSTILPTASNIFYTKFIAVTDYSTGSQYSYSDQSGNSISSKGGKINSNAGGEVLDAFVTPSLPFTATSSSSSASTTSSSSASTTTTSSSSKVTATATSNSTSSSSKSTSNTSKTTSVSSKASTTVNVTSTAKSTSASSASAKTTEIHTTSSTYIGYETTISGHASYVYTPAAIEATTINGTVDIDYLVTSSNHTYTISKLESLTTHSSTIMETITSCSNNACATTVSKQTDRAVIVGTDTTPVTKYTTEEKTVVATITSCSDDECSKTSLSPAVTTASTFSVSTEIVSEEHTVVDTITSCSNNACSKTLSTTTATHEHTVVDTITSCSNDACSKTSSTTTATHEHTVVDTITSCSNDACSKTNSANLVNGGETVVGGTTLAVSYGVSSSDDILFTQTTIYQTKYNSEFVTVTTGASSATLDAVATTSATLDAVASTTSIPETVASTSKTLDAVASYSSNNLSSIFEGSASLLISDSRLSLMIVAAILSVSMFV